MVRLAIPSHTRSMGIHISSGRGGGKSRLMGRGIAFHDFMRGYPVVIVDPHGPTIDNFLDKFCYLPREEQLAHKDRLIYCDMSGQTGYVPAFPLYYPAPTIYDSAFRLLDCIRRLDPNLMVAPVRGWNAIEIVGTNLGMVLVALNEPITSAQSLLTQPQLWESRLGQITGEAKVAAEYFLTVFYKSKLEQQRAEAFIPKILQFTHNIVNKRMFCASQQTLDWEQVIAEKSAVLLDFRGDRDVRFKILWAWRTFLEYVESRGTNRDCPISVIVDELSFLLALNSSGHDLLSADMGDLIDRISRNNNLWLTLAHQEMNQLPLMIQQSLMTMGTQIIGRTAHQDVAMDLVKRFFPYDPKWIKRTEPIFNDKTIAATREIEFSPMEQNHIRSQVFRNLERFEFIVITSTGEGGRPLPPEQINTSWIDQGVYYDKAVIDRVRRKLSERIGLAVTQEEAPVRMLTDAPALYAAPPRSSTKSRTNSSTSIPTDLDSDQRDHSGNQGGS